MASIHRGPQDFELLLTEAALSEREKQAVRSVALSLTAEEASRLMRVSPSTVGSYRQRAYAKIGVATKAEFLELPETIGWRRSQAEKVNASSPSQNEEVAHGEQPVQNNHEAVDSLQTPLPQAVQPKNSNCCETEDATNSGSRRYRRAIVTIACVIFAFALAPAIEAHYSPHY